MWSVYCPVGPQPIQTVVVVAIVAVLVLYADPRTDVKTFRQLQPIVELAVEVVVCRWTVAILVTLVDGARIKQGVAVLRETFAVPLTAPIATHLELQLVAPG